MTKKMVLGAAVVTCSLGLAPAQQTLDCPDLARALQDLVRADARARDFAELRRLRDVFGQPLKHLSMGMTHDFEIAIEEGATLVRIGSALFDSLRRRLWC